MLEIQVVKAVILGTANTWNAMPQKDFVIFFC